MATTNNTSTDAPAASEVARLASVWVAKHPELTERIQRAVALVANVDPIGPFGKGTFFVEGSDGHKYMVRVDRAARVSECTCLDSVKGHHCKHRLAVALYVAAQPK